MKKIYPNEKVDNMTLNKNTFESGLRQEKEVHWTEMKCPECGDKMYLDMGKIYCRSWLYMEGGC